MNLKFFIYVKIGIGRNFLNFVHFIFLKWEELIHDYYGVNSIYDKFKSINSCWIDFLCKEYFFILIYFRILLYWPEDTKQTDHLSRCRWC